MSPDFKDLLSIFNAHGVEYLVVGAHALAAHGHVRATGDLEVWVRPEQENARRVMRALAAFGAPLQDLRESDLTKPGLIFQIGIAPLRIDILSRLTVKFAEVSVAVLSSKHLIANKRAVGRAQDRADVEWLEKNRKD